MGLIVTGSIIAIVGWLVLLGGVGVSTGYGGQVANLHAMVIASNIILGGYALIVAGLVRSPSRNAAPEAIRSSPSVATPSPVGRSDRRPVKDIQVAGINGKLFSDGSVDVVQQSGVTRTFASAEEVRAFYRT